MGHANKFVPQPYPHRGSLESVTYRESLPTFVDGKGLNT